jgi:hypothetical protein
MPNISGCDSVRKDDWTSNHFPPDSNQRIQSALFLFQLEKSSEDSLHDRGTESHVRIPLHWPVKATHHAIEGSLVRLDNGHARAMQEKEQIVHRNGDLLCCVPSSPHPIGSA